MQVSAWVRSMKNPLVSDVEEVEVMAREEDRISIVRGAKSSRGGNFSGSRDAGAGGGRGCWGKWTDILMGKKMCKRSSSLDQERWVNVNKIRRGRGAVSQNFSTHKICQKVHLWFATLLICNKTVQNANDFELYQTFLAVPVFSLQSLQLSFPRLTLYTKIPSKL